MIIITVPFIHVVIASDHFSIGAGDVTRELLIFALLPLICVIQELLSLPADDWFPVLSHWKR